ncbi:hypothetical protein TetV_316 [Tetraselmis virus 1]|uniref:Uncharacterized protein n=1 Tax=Tetraselmis virus 1 TaxID=2060617 RepID=A0A2P0VNC9_9VIRU|nr:hypothetical protein QJ968_gp316 [Tetraselmis virus 1]AUF82408.1 hypothetical protein TetV_316 [Tetraselmis virus 1]
MNCEEVILEPINTMLDCLRRDFEYAKSQTLTSRNRNFFRISSKDKLSEFSDLMKTYLSVYEEFIKVINCAKERMNETENCYEKRVACFKSLEKLLPNKLYDVADQYIIDYTMTLISKTRECTESILKLEESNYRKNE